MIDSVSELCARIRSLIESRTQNLSQELAALRKERDEALADAEATSEVNALLQSKLDALSDASLARSTVDAAEFLRQGALEERAALVSWLRLSVSPDVHFVAGLLESLGARPLPGAALADPVFDQDSARRIDYEDPTKEQLAAWLRVQLRLVLGDDRRALPGWLDDVCVAGGMELDAIAVTLEGVARQIEKGGPFAQEENKS